MKVLTEYELRARCLPQDTQRFVVEAGVFVTPSAREYLRERGITLETATVAVMLQAAPSGGYVDAATGAKYPEKPEAMTHLRGNLLVPKGHPRILLRGRLDSLEAEMIQLQLLAQEEKQESLLEALGQLLDFTRRLLGSEVKEQPLGDFTLLGLDSAGLRRVSHNVDGALGVNHPVPDYRMGRACVALNHLRAQVRETELAAVQVGREDLIEALNRMSSAVYILFCRQLAATNLQERKGNSHA